MRIVYCIRTDSRAKNKQATIKDLWAPNPFSRSRTRVAITEVVQELRKKASELDVVLVNFIIWEKNEVDRSTEGMLGRTGNQQWKMSLTPINQKKLSVRKKRRVRHVYGGLWWTVNISISTELLISSVSRALNFSFLSHLWKVFHNFILRD